MNSLELAIPPPIIMLATALIMWFLSVFLPGSTLPGFGGLLGAIIIGAIGVGISMAGIVAFHRAQTTPDPRRPDAATTLVTSGVYRISRNPMYLGIQLVLIAWAIFLGNVAALLFAFVFALYIQRFQIKLEEHFLQEKFGAEFTAYRAKVRAWI